MQSTRHESMDWKKFLPFTIGKSEMTFLCEIDTLKNYCRILLSHWQNNFFYPAKSFVKCIGELRFLRKKMNWLEGNHSCTHFLFAHEKVPTNIWPLLMCPLYYFSTVIFAHVLYAHSSCSHCSKAHSSPAHSIKYPLYCLTKYWMPIYHVPTGH